MFKTFLNDYEAHLRNGGLYDLFEEQGYSRDVVDEMLAQQGMTLDEAIDQIMASMNVDEVVASATEVMTKRGNMYVLTTDTTYTLDGGAITFVSNDGTEEKLEYEYKDGVLTVVDTTGKGMEIFLSKELVKQ